LKSPLLSYGRARTQCDRSRKSSPSESNTPSTTSTTLSTDTGASPSTNAGSCRVARVIAGHRLRNRWIGMRFRLLQRLDRIDRRPIHLALAAVAAGALLATLYTWL